MTILPIPNSVILSNTHCMKLSASNHSRLGDIHINSHILHPERYLLMRAILHMFFFRPKLDCNVESCHTRWWQTKTLSPPVQRRLQSLFTWLAGWPASLSAGLPYYDGLCQNARNISSVKIHSEIILRFELRTEKRQWTWSSEMED